MHVAFSQRALFLFYTTFFYVHSFIVFWVLYSFLFTFFCIRYWIIMLKMNTTYLLWTIILWYAMNIMQTDTLYSNVNNFFVISLSLPSLCFSFLMSQYRNESFFFSLCVKMKNVLGKVKTAKKAFNDFSYSHGTCCWRCAK